MAFLLYSSFKTLMKTLSHMGQSYGFLLCGSFHDSFFSDKKIFHIGKVKWLSSCIHYQNIDAILGTYGAVILFSFVWVLSWLLNLFSNNDFSHGAGKCFFSCIHPLKHWWKPCHIWDSHMVFFCVGPFITHFFWQKDFSHKDR